MLNDLYQMKKITIPFLITAVIVIITFLLFKDMETFFSNSLNKVSHSPYTFASISFLVLTLDIVLPVPSSVVMYINGYVLGVLAGSALSLISLLAGAILGYFLGKLTSAGVKAKSDSATENIMAKYGAMAILISRGIPIISESVCIVCGFNKMPFKQYVMFNILGYLPLCLVYAYCGNVGYDKNTFLLTFGFSVLLTVIFWIIGRALLFRPDHINAD